MLASLEFKSLNGSRNKGLRTDDSYYFALGSHTQHWIVVAFEASIKNINRQHVKHDNDKECMKQLEAKV